MYRQDLAPTNPVLFSIWKLPKVWNLQAEVENIPNEEIAQKKISLKTVLFIENL